MKPDEELIREAGRGDATAFVELYRRHQADLFRFAWHMTGSRDMAEEAVQETFLALMRKPEAWQSNRGAVRPFLFGIVRNHVLRQITARRDFDSIDADIAVDEDLLGTLEHEERIAAVRDAVLSLPAQYREVAVLCDMEEASYEDAARLLNCPIGTVRSRLSRARQLLAMKLRAGLMEKVN